MLQSSTARSVFVRAKVGELELSKATAFIVEGASGRILVTNRHVVTGVHQETRQTLSSTGAVPDHLLVSLHASFAVGELFTIDLPLIDGDQTPLWHEHPTLGARADVVGLKLPDLREVAYYSYDLDQPGPDIMVSPTDMVSVVGFPFGISTAIFPIWSTGFVASEPELDFDGLPMFLIDCRSRPGQSGSPVVAHRSGGAVTTSTGDIGMFTGPVTRFLGVYSGRVHKDSDLGMVWKLRCLQELVGAIP